MEEWGVDDSIMEGQVGGRQFNPIPSKREKGLSGVLVWRPELVKHHSANWGRKKRTTVTLCARQIFQCTFLLPLLLC